MVILQKIISFAKRLEDPEHPLLGPTLKGLYVFGLWQSGSKLRNTCFNLVYCCSLIFVATQFIELWIVRHDYLEALYNLSLSALGFVCLFKVFSYIFCQSEWRTLVHEISTEEISQIGKQDEVCAEIMKKYRKYARMVTYFLWNLVVFTNISKIVAPLLKYITSAEYREKISNGTEPLPQIFSSWFPFDKTKMPGYSIAIFVHIVINVNGGSVVALYDTNALVIMVFIKGQLAILREHCRRLFDGEGKLKRDVVLQRIKECHRLHNFIVKQSDLFNSLFSPVMFIYVLVCSAMICCSVVQYTYGEATAAQKTWVTQYTTALITQLFLFSWHCNEVVVESLQVDRGVYESEWWRADVRTRKQVAMLAGKLTHVLAYNAGPFTTLDVPTFIDIMKAYYSFLTLLIQMKGE